MILLKQPYHFLNSLPAVLDLFYGPVGSVFSFLVQDKVSLVSSRLFVLLLPASLLRDLADITKLLVSEQQVDQIQQLL